MPRRSPDLPGASTEENAKIGRLRDDGAPAVTAWETDPVVVAAALRDNATVVCAASADSDAPAPAEAVASENRRNHDDVDPDPTSAVVHQLTPPPHS